MLLCSDGITAAMPETRIAELLARRALARIFVAEAHAATAEKPELRDDVSAIAIDIAQRSRSSNTVAQRLEVPAALRAGDDIDGHRLVRPLAATARVWLATEATGAKVVRSSLRWKPRKARACATPLCAKPGTPPGSSRRLNPAFPLWLESVLLRALEPDAERRYQNFSEFAFDLTHPDSVASHHRKGAPLLERNPLLFYQLLALLSVILNFWLIYRLTRG